MTDTDFPAVVPEPAVIAVAKAEAAKPARKPRKAVAKPVVEKVVIDLAPVALTPDEVAANLHTRQERLEAAYDAADAENNGPRADALWRASRRVEAQLTTLAVSASLS